MLGYAAVVFATMNVVGGFVVTNRMLAMFRTRK
jgi:H+-translocating NAD(P) transhydrogenase subunit alpha